MFATRLERTTTMTRETMMETSMAATIMAPTHNYKRLPDATDAADQMQQNHFHTMILILQRVTVHCNKD